MDRELLAKADQIVASLSPGKRESVREIVIDSIRRGHVDERSRLYLTSVSGSTLLGDVLEEALASSGHDIVPPQEIGV